MQLGFLDKEEVGIEDVCILLEVVVLLVIVYDAIS